jgi:FkbM family methyltransferase
MYGPLNKIGKIFAIPFSYLVSNRISYQFFTLIKIYLSILLGEGAGNGWNLESETDAAIKIIQRKHNTNEHLTIFDIGANIGNWSDLLAKRIKNATYYLFEPQPGCHSYIMEKKIPNMRLFPFAVSSFPGESINLFSSSENTEIASIYQRRDSYFQKEHYHKIEVLTTTIDTVIANNDIKRVDYIKMDIEGHELEALKGALISLQNGIIHAIAFEFGSANINSRTYFHDFWDFLFPLGYHFYRILPWGGLLPVLEYSEDLEYLRGATNYIAAKE